MVVLQHSLKKPVVQLRSSEPLAASLGEEEGRVGELLGVGEREATARKETVPPCHISLELFF